MTRIPTLDEQLKNMKSLLRTMCDRVLTGLTVISQHLESPRPEQLVKIVVLDTEIDNMETAVDETVLQIFATQQPLAYELRLVYATAKIAHHIERVGDAVESLARQLASRQHRTHHDMIQKMLADTKDLFNRSYAAMFEGDLAQIHDIHLLDDKVDVWQRGLYSEARRILNGPADKSDVDNALQLINISTKLEKIADLCCNWAEQIDFAEHGNARRKLKKRKHRIVFMDDNRGLTASLAACFLSDAVKEFVDVSVITRSNARHISVLNFSDLLIREKVTPQVFPIGTLQAMQWNRCLMLIHLGQFELSQDERDQIPYKTVRLTWPEAQLRGEVLDWVAGQDAATQFTLEDVAGLERLIPALQTRASELKNILARAQPNV